MPVKIRLRRCGKKGQPFYHVVIADGRAPRDGRFIEKIGTYNPLTNPATIVLDSERALHWVNCGAQPTDTARMILKREGVYLKKHLDGGVQKGAFTQEQADAKLAAWKDEKSRKLNSVVEEERNAARKDRKDRLAAETKVREAKEAVLNEKRRAAAEAEAAKRAEAEAAAATETEATTEAPAETTAEENPTTEA